MNRMLIRNWRNDWWIAVRIDTGGLADLQTFGQLPNTVKFTPAHPKTIGLRVGFPMVGKMFSAFGVFKFLSFAFNNLKV